MVSYFVFHTWYLICEVHGHLAFCAYTMAVTGAPLFVYLRVSLLWSSRSEHSKALHCRCLSSDICQGSEPKSDKEYSMLWRFRPLPWRECRRHPFPLGCTCRLTCSHLTWHHHNPKMYTSGVFINIFVNRIMN